MARLSGFGISVDLPDGWDGRIYSRETPAGTRATLHAGTFPLPPDRGDFGSGAVELMGDEDVLVVLLEYDPAVVDQALFQSDVPSRLDPGAFSPTVLQRSIPGQAGSQTFFQANGRAFCLYVVVGQVANRARLASVANQVVGAIRIE